jgi:hypothetical protein
MQCGDLECNSERFTKSGASFATDLPALVLLPGMGKTMSNRSIRKSRSRWKLRTGSGILEVVRKSAKAGICGLRKRRSLCTKFTHECIFYLYTGIHFLLNASHWDPKNSHWDSKRVKVTPQGYPTCWRLANSFHSRSFFRKSCLRFVLLTYNCEQSVSAKMDPPFIQLLASREFFFLQILQQKHSRQLVCIYNAASKQQRPRMFFLRIG